MSLLAYRGSVRTAAGSPVKLDPRGARFAAALTSSVLGAVLLADSATWGTVLLGVQWTLFAWGALLGPQRAPSAWLFRALVRPRLAPPVEWEDLAPARFAQAIGLMFATVALIGFLAGADSVGLVATGLALWAAFLNAAFGFCLGCEMYLRLRKLTSR